MRLFPMDGNMGRNESFAEQPNRLRPRSAVEVADQNLLDCPAVSAHPLKQAFGLKSTPLVALLIQLVVKMSVAKI
jgi:hypothetical protein